MKSFIMREIPSGGNLEKKRRTRKKTKKQNKKASKKKEKERRGPEKKVFFQRREKACKNQDNGKKLRQVKGAVAESPATSDLAAAFCSCLILMASSLTGLGMKVMSAPSFTSRPIHQSLLYFCHTQKKHPPFVSLEKLFFFFPCVHFAKMDSPP